ncbi:MAG: bifunctional phosphopantothenoylcysteine decarboxylase/phosphopantothenate--cysteine ligase CoaBC [Marinilabiliaceae bacterium]|nr:bifunctional phosphopantothenoylcysteine decarboxylase/phosphopantothenate--cysteine ligase CoaBC [Marinilabiliaceae bacterium]
MLKGKKIILGITGSIAAYKAAYLLRLLMKEGAEVQVLLTKAGREFITPVTLSALSNKPVLGEFFNTGDGTWHSHVDLGLWADLFLVAPASANTLAKMANGICDNLLLTTYLSAKCPVMIAPAMDLDMFEHPANQQNICTLMARGCKVIDPGTGELASGLWGKGRMEEPENIIKKLKDFFTPPTSPLHGKNILVTAGPTYEKIDPVRFIGNYSSGKMGFAIADELAARGARVHLVTGPVSIGIPAGMHEVTRVESAAQMHQACVDCFPQMNAAIMSAAVADYTPANVAEQKMKRAGDELTLTLSPTRDIAAALGQSKQAGQVLVGFALESHDALTNAHKKLANKNLDFIVLNEAGKPGVGFHGDTNKVTIIDKDNKQTDYPLKSKREVAADIVDMLERYF